MSTTIWVVWRFSPTVRQSFSRLKVQSSSPLTVWQSNRPTVWQSLSWVRTVTWDHQLLDPSGWQSHYGKVSWWFYKREKPLQLRRTGTQNLDFAMGVFVYLTPLYFLVLNLFIFTWSPALFSISNNTPTFLLVVKYRRGTTPNFNTEEQSGSSNGVVIEKERSRVRGPTMEQLW